MSADIRVIRLKRKNMQNKTDVNFFAAPPFDAMEIEKTEITDSLMTIIGMGTSKESETEDVMVQSYSLYCSEKMLNSETDINWYGDPFAEREQENNASFLSIIQVNIMPDAIQRISSDEIKEGVAEAFYADLQEAVKKYMGEISGSGIKLRIYQMLSKGDFAVVIRSNEKAAAFQLASWIEQRSAGNDSNADKSSLALYETHTILTLNGSIIQQENVEEKTQPVRPENHTKMTFSPIHKKDSLEDKADKKYNDVKDKYNDTKAKLAQIPAYRKNMLYYMDLLGNLITLCRYMNASQDTRIYAITLLELLDIIIDSINVYIKLSKKESEQILNLLEDYIRESVWTLNGYAQSVQTSNYNVETNLSVEKLLIGYSEILRTFMKYYEEKKLKKIDEIEQMFHTFKDRILLPVVVSALNEGDMSVEVFFLEGVTKDWKTEREIWDKTEKMRHCMVVRVPTYKELVNIRIMIVTLFHEVAHQFRYEARGKRNITMRHYLIHKSMEQLAQKLTQRIQNKLEVYDREEVFMQFLRDAFYEAYIRCYKKNPTGNRKYNLQRAPFNSFETELISDLEMRLREKIKKESVKNVLEEFLKEILKYHEQMSTQCRDAILRLNELLAITSDKIGNYESEIKEQVTNCAYVLAFECACQNTDHKKKIEPPEWEKEGVKQWAEDTKDFDYIGDWEKHFAKISHEKKSAYNMIWRNFNNFHDWIKKNYKKETIENAEKMDEFLQCAYEMACDNWKKQENKDSDNSFFEKQAAMARMLGIDFNTKDNFKIFETQVSNVLRQELDDIIKGVTWRIRKYREETADMLMCSALGLSPIGYISLLAVNWAIGEEFSDTHIARCMNVFLFQWCLDKKYEISETKIAEQCQEMVEKLEEAVKAVREALGISERKKLDTLEKEKRETRKKKEFEKLEDKISDIQEDLFYIREEKDKSGKLENDEAILEALKIYENMTNLILIPIYYHEDFIEYMKDYTRLKNDYVRAYKKLNTLNADMRNIKNEPILQKLGEFCKQIGEWQNDLTAVLPDKTKSEEINRICLEFLLEMYYVNKRRIAREIGEQ